MTDQNQLLSDTLQKGLEYARLALSEHEAKYGRHPAVEADHKVIVDDVTALEGALDRLAEGGESVSLYGRVKISGPREDVEHVVRLLPAVDDQPAEGGKAREFFAYHSDMGVEFFNGPDAEAAVKSLCDENLKLERAEAESTGEWADDRAESIRWGVVLGRAKFFENPGQEGEDSGDYKMVGYTTPPASQEQAQQPNTQAWANETGLRQIECPSCGDLAVAYDPQQPSGEVVAVPDTEKLRKIVTRHALQLEDFHEALDFQIERARALLREFALPAQPQGAVSRSQAMRDAGFSARDTRLTCDECGGKYSTQTLPVHKCAAQPQGAGEVVLPDGWVPLTIEHEPGYPEDVAYGPQLMMDRLKKWLDRHFATIATPKPEPMTRQPTLTAHFPPDQEPTV